MNIIKYVKLKNQNKYFILNEKHIRVAEKYIRVLSFSNDLRKSAGKKCNKVFINFV